MQKCVFSIEGKDYGKLKDILAADPYERDSFPVVGYVLKESKAVGLKGGSYVVYFKSADAAILEKLKTRLKILETAKELDGGERDKIANLIEGEEDNAAAGLGSIFG